MPKWLRMTLSRHMAMGIPAGIGLRSDDGHPSGGTAPSGTDSGNPAPEGQPEGAPANEPAQPADGAPKGEEIDWKAKAREWEKRAKANTKAADELEKLKAAQMTETEKAVAAAKAEGHAEAMKAAGVKLATSELKLAAKDKGLNLGDVEEFITVEKFVDENGDVDSAAIKKAVAAFAKVSPTPAPGKSGAPLPGGSAGRSNTTTSLNAAVAARYSK